MTATVEMPASEHDRKMSELARLRYANEDQAEKIAALRAENVRLRTALEKTCDALFDDAVNGHLNHAQQITMDGIGEVYETARAALLRELGEVE